MSPVQDLWIRLLIIIHPIEIHQNILLLCSLNCKNQSLYFIRIFTPILGSGIEIDDWSAVVPCAGEGDRPAKGILQPASPLQPQTYIKVKTREGWPLLTVETEANGDSKSTNEWVHPLFVGWAVHASTRDFCPGMDALVDPVQTKITSSSHTISLYVSPIAQEAGQANVQGRLSPNVSLWLKQSSMSSN
jgi:hypothetical protein